MSNLIIMVTLIVFGLIAVTLTYLWYVRLIKYHNQFKESLSGIDVQLKKRSNLIPNILTLTKKYIQHEQSLLTDITKLRTQVDETYESDDSNAIKQHFAAADALASQMGKLMISVENYPELKADQIIIETKRTYNEVEGKIAASRRFYNSSVTQLNNAVQIFPGSLIARAINIKAKPFYQTDDTAKAPVAASDYL